MRSRFVLAAVILSTLMVADAFARGGGGGGMGGGNVGGHPSWQGSNPPGLSRGVKTGWNSGSVPPGWSKGKKTGWKGHNVPPGLYGR